MGTLLNRRRTETDERFEKLRKRLQQADRLISGKACVYATGSFARGEASQQSDLDLFIAGRHKNGQRLLSRLDEIRIKADLIEATRKLGIPDFSGDGEYLQHYTVDELIKTFGKPEDDANNTFTARLLLLLESRPLLGKSVYHEVIADVIAAYWRDYKDHTDDFMPAFLSNDILRLWRTFCVNYEARTVSEPALKKAKRKLKNYKLKHSRLLTCYSALLHLLAVFSEKGTVSRLNAAKMIRLTPTLRLEWILRRPRFAMAHAKIEEVLKHYEGFLRETDADERVLVRRFLESKRGGEYFQGANKLGDLVYEVLESIGEKNRFHRLLIV